MTDKKDLAYLLAFLLLLAFLFQQFLFTDTTFFVRDVTRLEIPSRLLGTQLLREGDFALWTDAFGNGQPFLANPKNAVFYPTTWLFLILPFFLAFKLHYVIHIIAAYLGIYYLAKSYSLSRMASFLAAVIFLTGGPYLSSVEFYNHIAALAWLPWVLLCSRLTYRRAGWRVIVPAVFWTLAVLAGSPEIVVVAVLLVLLQTLFLSENKQREIPLVVLPLILALLLSSVQVMPTIEHWNRSVRKAVRTSEWPLELTQLLNLSFPDILGDDRKPGHEDFWAGEFFDRGKPLHYSLYISFAPLLLALFAFQRPSKKAAWFLSCSMALFFLLSLGRYSMAYPIILKIPLLASIFYPVKFMIGFAFALSLLAALGFDQVFRSGRIQKKRIYLVSSLSACSLIAYLVFRMEGIRFFIKLFGLTAEASAQGLQRSFWHGTGVLMLYAAILFFFALPRRPLRGAALVFLAVLVADLAYHNKSINPVIPTSFFRKTTLLGPSSEPIRIHREDSVPEELRPTLRTAEGAARYYRRSLYPFCGIGEGIRYLYNEDRYFFYTSGYNRLWRSAVGSRRSEFIKLLLAQGCEYFIGHAPLPGLPAQIVDVQGHSLYVQKMSGHVPPAYIVHRSVKATSLKEAFGILKEESFDPRKAAILKEESPIPSADFPSDDANTRLDTVLDASAKKLFSLSTSHPGLLIIPGHSAPGWKAWIDGRPAAVLEALPASRAISIPAGEHTVVLKYRPRSFALGGFVTLFSLIALGVYLASPLLGGRSRLEKKSRSG